MSEKILAKIAEFEEDRRMFWDESESDYSKDINYDMEAMIRGYRAVLEIKTYAERGVPLSSMDFEMELQDKVILKVRQAIEEAMK